MNKVMINSLFSELQKIAQDVEVNHRDARKEELKQKAKNVAAIVGGAATGEGLALLTNMALRSAAKRYGRSLPSWSPWAVQGLLVPTMGVGAHMAHSSMREKDKQLLEEARRRGSR